MAPATSKPKEAIHKEDGQRNNNQKTANDKKKGNVIIFQLMLVAHLIHTNCLLFLGFIVPVTLIRIVALLGSVFLNSVVALVIFCNYNISSGLNAFYFISNAIFQIILVLCFFGSLVQVSFAMWLDKMNQRSGTNFSSNDMELSNRMKVDGLVDCLFVGVALLASGVHGFLLHNIIWLKKRAGSLPQSEKSRNDAKNEKIGGNESGTGGHTGAGNPNYIVYVA